LNHAPKKKLTLVNKQGKEEHTYIEYLAEDKFNVYMDDPNGFLSPLAMDVEVKHNPLSPDEILLVDNQQSKNIYYYIDDDNNITQLDYEGNPNEL
jgi:hypothetical protein